MREDLIWSNVILNKSIQFALGMIVYCDNLNKRGYYVLSKQLLRSSCSIGANIMEAQNAESDPDFVHKMKIAAKESDEAQYWLLLCSHSENCPKPEQEGKLLEEIQKLLSSIISTSRKKIKK